MVFREYFVFLVLILSQVHCYNVAADVSHRGINSSFLESVLDPQECRRQIRAIRRNAALFFQFADSGLRTPRGVLTGNTADLGNYFQCTGINQELEDIHIEGKHCFIRVPVNQSFGIPNIENEQGFLYNPYLAFDQGWVYHPGSGYMQAPRFLPSSLKLGEATATFVEEYNLKRARILALSGDFSGFELDRSTPETNPLINTVFRLSVCVPKPCTSEQAINSFFFNISAIGFQFTDDYCRVPGDKSWVSADYVAIAIFSLLGFVTLLSTCYDLTYQFILKKDLKQISNLYRSFSVYTNGQRLTTFNYGSGTLQCVDGIRTLAMIWVIIGHSFSTEPFIANPIDSNTWMFSADALWITAATMTVDTFFTLAGVLLVYTTAGKMKHITFIKNLHWFYLNRYMRVTPLLAAAVLLQTSYYNRMTDGPHWVTVSSHTQQCRENWWATLLHVQNYLHPWNMCVTHSWYIAIDFQLYLVSPVVLFWVYTNKKKLAWMGLTGGLAAVIIASTIYCFTQNLPGGILVPTRWSQFMEYYEKYYFNTLTRGSPFFVGMAAGYILHIYRKKRIQMPWIVAVLLWAISGAILGGIFYYTYRIKQMDWDNQLIDNIMNSFMKPSYGFAICWLIIACVHGYSGPINWFLSHEYWRLPARLSYGMFLFHYPLMYAINASTVAPVYFSVGRFTFKFLSYLVMSVVYSFILTVLVDSPVTVLFKMFMDAVKGKKPPIKKDETGNNIPNGDSKRLSLSRLSIKEDKLGPAQENKDSVDVTNGGGDIMTKTIDNNEVIANLSDVKSISSDIQEIIDIKNANVIASNMTDINRNSNDIVDVESNFNEVPDKVGNYTNVDLSEASNATHSNIIDANIGDQTTSDIRYQ